MYAFIISLNKTKTYKGNEDSWPWTLHQYHLIYIIHYPDSWPWTLHQCHLICIIIWFILHIIHLVYVCRENHVSLCLEQVKSMSAMFSHWYSRMFLTHSIVLPWVQVEVPYTQPCSPTGTGGGSLHTALFSHGYSRGFLKHSNVLHLKIWTLQRRSFISHTTLC